MTSQFGKNLRVSVFGQSHSEAIGCVIEGIPAGFAIDTQALAAFMARRSPGKNAWSTQRKEADAFEIVSGVKDGVACGAPLCALIRNTNVRSRDYDALKTVPRPGHADYVAEVKFGGHQDGSGGGHFSGRLTAPLCLAGGIALQLLREAGVRIGAHILQVRDIADEAFPLQGIDEAMLDDLARKAFATLDDGAGEAMQACIDATRFVMDSVGGVVECAAIGVPAGIGEPMFAGIEGAIASLCFGIPAVKGVEFGRGFEAASMMGSEHNDGYRMDDGRVRFASNNAGGILGGISTGEPIVFRVAFKPTPSIARPQRSVNLRDGVDEVLRIEGRHDPCIVPRAVPVVEACCALALYDLMVEARAAR